MNISHSLSEYFTPFNISLACLIIILTMFANSSTIKFNVGGRHFEVSRDLIDTHSETMLGKLVSDAWQEDPEEEVFIDRNGDIFAHVLDYLRYGR